MHIVLFFVAQLNPKNTSVDFADYIEDEDEGRKRGRPRDMFVTYAQLLENRIDTAADFAHRKYPLLKFDYRWVALSSEPDGCHCSCILCVWSNSRSLFSLKRDDGRRYGNLLVTMKASDFVYHCFNQGHCAITRPLRDYIMQCNLARNGDATSKKINLKTAIDYAVNDPVKLLQIAKQYVL